MKKKLFYCILIIVFLELFFRVLINFNSPLKLWSNKINLHAKYYKNLSSIKSYNYDSSKVNILILGGSVVFEDLVSFYRNSTKHSISFCNFKDSKFNVLNLAFPGHTSLDSKYKFDLLKEYNFDYIFIYHGINDARSNNIATFEFNEDYRHIEFYDELYILNRHPEVNYYTSFYIADFICNKLLKFIGFKSYIPKEFLSFMKGKDQDIIDDFFNRECHYLSKNTFYNNIEHIVKESIQRNIQPVLFTYAYYHASNYTLRDFYKSNLDYATNFFPTELYGDPNCIPLAIKKHNNQIVKIAEEYKKDLLFYDFESSLEKSKRYFMDICHLTESGCNEMHKAIYNIIEDKNARNTLSKEVLH